MFFASLERFFGSWSPPPEVPVRSERDYGRSLHAVVVKFPEEAARARALGAPVHVIENGVPFPARAARGSDGARVVWGTAARVAPQKRLELLLDALRLATPRMPPHVLRIAGAPETGSEAYAAALTARAEGLSVEWLGERADIPAFLDGLDAFAMVAEPAGCPNASLEAMAAGLAVVITDVGGARAQVLDGETGAVCPRDDVSALAEALVALSWDESRRKRMGAAGRARAAAHFDVSRMTDDYERLLLGASSAP
jgi:glycosyltransferase involved in cell wall biosynthesis